MKRMFLLSALLCAGTLANGQEQKLMMDGKTIGAVAGKGAELQFDFEKGTDGLTVSVQGPNGYRAFKDRRIVRKSLQLKEYGKLPDGLYQFEVTGIGPDKYDLASPPLNNGRGPKELAARNTRLTTGGSFMVRDGAIFAITTQTDVGSDIDGK